MPGSAAEPVFFSRPSAFRAWLQAHHARARELWVGFYKVGSGKPSLSWGESVDEALCFGWIDGLRKGIGAESYKIRFIPRKPGGNWSAVNIAKVAALKKRGLMKPAGLKAFERRSEAKSRIYSYEQKGVALKPAELKAFKAAASAWAFFESRAPSYRKAASWWVLSSKRPETRQRRLESLISLCAEKKTLKHLTRKPA